MGQARVVLVGVPETTRFTDQFIEPRVQKRHAKDVGTFALPGTLVQSIVDPVSVEKQVGRASA